MRAPDVVKATDAGASNFCSIRAVPVAIAAATMQATMKTRMTVIFSGDDQNQYRPARPDIKRYFGSFQGAGVSKPLYQPS
jgi:hypothetical protein